MKCPFQHDPINIGCKFCVYYFRLRRPERPNKAEERKAHNAWVLRLFGITPKEDR